MLPYSLTGFTFRERIALSWRFFCAHEECAWVYEGASVLPYRNRRSSCALGCIQAASSTLCMARSPGALDWRGRSPIYYSCQHQHNGYKGTTTIPAPLRSRRSPTTRNISGMPNPRVWSTSDQLMSSLLLNPRHSISRRCSDFYPPPPHRRRRYLRWLTDSTRKTGEVRPRLGQASRTKRGECLWPTCEIGISQQLRR